MTQTLRRELRDKFSQILNENYGISINAMADKLADAALEIRYKESQPPPITYTRPDEEKFDAAAYKKRIANAMASGFSEHEDIRQRFERELRRTPDWKHKDWDKLLGYLYIKEKSGEKLEKFASWWWSNDWRGQRGQPPEARQVRELWSNAFPVGRSQSQADLDKILEEMKGPTVGELMARMKNENDVS